MIASVENIEQLKQIGFKEVKEGKIYKFRDVVAKESGGYLSFYYDSKSIPIINKIESVKKIIEGIYEYMFEK